MEAIFPRGEEFTVNISNLLTTAEAIYRNVVFSPACDAGLRSDSMFFVDLHALRSNIDALLDMTCYEESR